MPAVHSHDLGGETFLVMAGQIEFTVADEHVVCQPGQTIYVPPRTTHAVRAVGEEPGVIYLSSHCVRLIEVLDAFEPQSPEEASDVKRVRQLASQGDPWPRALPLHVTGSAVVVHPPTRRVLLRWHQRMHAWLQVGGHGDMGETDPYVVALREAEEETGLRDLTPWPHRAQPTLVQVVIVPVPARKREPAHQHADFRYGLATATPEAATPESPSAQLKWLDIDEALATVAEDNLRVCLLRIAEVLS